MKKKGFNLIGLGLILYCINVSVPFLGIGDGKLGITFIPVSAVVSYILIGLGIRNVNKYRNKFKTSSLLFYICAGLIGLVSIVLPLLTKNGFEEIFDLYSQLLSNMNYEVSDIYILYILTNIIKGLVIYLFLIALIEVIATVGIFIMLYGLSYENINQDHYVKLNKYGKKSTIFNLVALCTSVIMVLFMYKFFSNIFMNPTNDVKLIIDYFLMVSMMPICVIFSIFTIVNKIKFIVNVFKTPSNIIVKQESSSFEYTEQL